MGYLFGRDRGHNLSKITEPLIDEAGTSAFAKSNRIEQQSIRPRLAVDLGGA